MRTLIAVLVVPLWAVPASAWWQPTHEEITKAAAKTPVGTFALDEVLIKSCDPQICRTPRAQDTGRNESPKLDGLDAAQVG